MNVPQDQDSKLFTVIIEFNNKIGGVSRDQVRIRAHTIEEKTEGNQTILTFKEGRKTVGKVKGVVIAWWSDDISNVEAMEF